MKNKKKLVESPIKARVRQYIAEGEMDNAESALAAKDLVDRLQDTVVELGKMSNDELPHLVDSIRSSFGPEAAEQYSSVANQTISDLLNIVKEKKIELENATLVLTGDASAPKSDLGLPDEAEGGEVPPADGEGDLSPEDVDLGSEDIEPEVSAKNPLGRETRVPAEESFNKKLTQAKIVALDEALRATNAKKFPLKAKRLAEELRKVVTRAIKEEAKEKASKKTDKKDSKKKPEWLLKKELAAEKKEGKNTKTDKKDTKKKK